MNSAMEIANYLVYLMSEYYSDLSNMKLNKLLYYAQGHSLKSLSRPLFSDTIEAWKYGPIVSNVYHAYKDKGDNPITEYDKSTLNAVSDEVRDLLIDIARVYGRYSAVALKNMTHVPQSPWARVYKENEQHIVIPNNLIKEYFDSHVEEIKPIELNLSEEDFIGHFNENGVLVLPKEWDDE